MLLQSKDNFILLQLSSTSRWVGREGGGRCALLLKHNSFNVAVANLDGTA